VRKGGIAGPPFPLGMGFRLHIAREGRGTDEQYGNRVPATAAWRAPVRGFGEGGGGERGVVRKVGRPGLCPRTRGRLPIKKKRGKGRNRRIVEKEATCGAPPSPERKKKRGGGGGGGKRIVASSSGRASPAFFIVPVGGKREREGENAATRKKRAEGRPFRLSRERRRGKRKPSPRREWG